MTGKIPRKSFEKVGLLLEALHPKALSISYIRKRCMIKGSSAELICIAMGAEKVETTGGVFYKWKGKE